MPDKFSSSLEKEGFILTDETCRAFLKQLDDHCHNPYVFILTLNTGDWEHIGDGLLADKYNRYRSLSSKEIEVNKEVMDIEREIREVYKNEKDKEIKKTIS